MKTKAFLSAVVLTILVLNFLTFGLRIPLAADVFVGSISILSDGSVSPSNAPIQRNGNLYTLESNTSSSGNGIGVWKDNIVIDGAGYCISGSGAYGEGSGAFLYGRTNVTIQNLGIMGFYAGITLAPLDENLGPFSTLNIIVRNNIENNSYGVSLYRSSDNKISDNTITANTCGIFMMDTCYRNLISQNNITNNSGGIEDGSDKPQGGCLYTNVTANLIAENGFGISLLGLSSISHNYIMQNKGDGIIAGNTHGADGSWTNVFMNHVENNAGDGMRFYGSSHSDVTNNDITGNGNGIVFDTFWYYGDFIPFNNTVSGNSIVGNAGDGIRFVGSHNSMISQNNIKVNGANGIYFDRIAGENPDFGDYIYCLNNSVLRNNITANSKWGIYLRGYDNEVAENDITRNALSGVLIWGSGNSVSDNNVTSNQSDGIYMFDSPNTSMMRNLIDANNLTGIRVEVGSEGSDYCNIIENRVTGNDVGIGIYASSFHYLFLNTIASNYIGLHICNSHNNTIVMNNITTNAFCGILFESVPELGGDWLPNWNLLYHNNFLNNTLQVENSAISSNVWDDGYLFGGNYWSDYLQKHPSASQIDDSGIWNTPYVIDANNTDQYPLMFPCTDFIIVKSEYTGCFMKNLHLNNTFGVYTSHGGLRPINVYGTLSDILGNERSVSFSSVSDPSGAYLSEPIDMGNLPLLSTLSTLQVFAAYSDGKVLNENHSIVVIPTPSWLWSILNAYADVTFDTTKQGQWDNSYMLHIEKEFDLSGIFNITIPIPKFAGGGNYTLLPSVQFGFSFWSNGTCEISVSGITETVPIEFGIGSVTAHIRITAAGVIALENNTIVWVSATFSVDVGASASINIPLPSGYTFDVPGVGKVTIGLSATVKFDADFVATIVLAPTENKSEELISGIGIMIQSITGKISFGVGLAISAGCGIASITGEGDLDVRVHLQATQPYIYDFAISGTVSIDYHVLFWSGTIWSETATLYHYPNDTEVIPDPANFTILARYYNTSDYEEFEWTNGSLSGKVIHNVYPFTRISAVSSGNSAYILYTDDNVSMPEQSGIYWNGLEFNSSQRTLRPLSLPTIADRIFFNPVAISLPNGTLLVMWNSIPLSEVSNAAGPLNISEVIPEYSCFDTETGSWGPVVNLPSSGVTTSYLLSADSTGCYALVLEGDSLFSSNQTLVEYNLPNGSEMRSMSVTNVSNIISFSSFSDIAVLETLDGSYKMLNLSSYELIDLPLMSGCQIKNVQLATNSANSLAILYSNSTSDVFSIYDISSNTTSFSMNVSQSTSHLTLIQVASGYYLVTTDSSGITTYLLGKQSAETRVRAYLFSPMENITSMGSTITDDGILVYTTANYGNASYPLLDLTLTFIPTSTLQPITASFTYSPATPNAGDTLTFDASGSTSTGTITQYAWDFGDENTTAASDALITHVYANPGTYNVTLTVTDSLGLTDSAWQTITASQNIPVRILGDMNGDGKVDIYDAIIFAHFFGLQKGDERWNANADMNQDGIIDIFDAIMIAQNFGGSGSS